jgi:hemoglobin/transferrin/lactoferrin receptor protein
MSRSLAVIPAIIVLSMYALGAEIHGTVVGAGQNPVPGAVVLHRGSGAKTETDAGGKFVLEVPHADRVRLEVIHPDYYEREFLVERKAFGKALFVLVPLIRQNEEVLVTALRYPELSIDVPAASTIVTEQTLAEKMAPNLTEALQEVPGLGGLGAGGFSLVPSVRGLARRRVLYLIDGARLESDRRTGPNGSFVSPEDIARIEVLRSASSVLYGSDAIGGVIQVMTRGPRSDDGLQGRLRTGYATVNGEKGAGFELEGARRPWAFSLSLQYVDAGEYSMPGGEKALQSQYTQGSFLAKVGHLTDRHEIVLSYLGARGTEIGKPSPTAATKPTWYPRENQNLLQLHWKENDVGKGGELLFHAFVNPNFLETQTNTYDAFSFLALESYAKTDSADFGAQLSYAKKISPAFRLEGGVDYFGRSGADAYNRYTTLDTSGAVTAVAEEYPYLDGSRGDLGIFLSGDYSGIKRLDILAGARYDILRMKALPLDTAAPVVTHDDQPTGFVALSYKLHEHMTAFANVSRAYRLASINEKYYTGISGRGFIVGNPDLRPESSLNLDAGLKFPGRRFFFGLYAFRYRIDDMIERFRLDPTTYTYGNIERGQLQGFEIEAEAFLLAGWKIFGNAARISGKSLETGAPLNDVPPHQIYAGTRFWAGKFSAELNATFRLAKPDPGPAEVPVNASQLVNLRATYLWHELSFYILLGNVFNATYIARADPDAMVEPGRNLRLGFAYAF